ncbi:MAG: alpha/beta hydrolase fold protein [Actinomycetia bacterium]|nr:alpha/beta hydrolase fold protein [Actinomycetes bacterium]
MDIVRSADGTTIAYEREGSGPPLVIVTGALGDRHTSRALAALLVRHRTVYRYDRRGRTDSGTTPPYAVDREVEDLAAVIGVAGPGAAVYGHSSGAALALLAAARGVPMTALTVHEPPYRVDGHGNAGLESAVSAALAAGDRPGAVKRFLAGAVGLPPEVVAEAETWPDWAGMCGIAHTLPYDLAIGGDGTVPAELARITVPTLVLHGTESFDWIGAGMAKLVDTIPGATGEVLVGQEHGVDPAAVVPYLT